MKAIGNTRVSHMLDRQLETGQLSHAYLFFGPEGVGKFDLALQFAHEATRNDNNHLDQDIHVVEPELIEEKGRTRKKEISIVQIREGQHFLSLSARNNKYRILIIREGEMLGIQAQNALLKSLEDPSGNSIIIIVAKNENRLLATVLSRCQKVGFNLVKLEELVCSFASRKENLDEIARWSLGRPVWMEKMIADPLEIERRRKIKVEFEIISRGTNNQKMKIIDRISKDKESIKENVKLWIVFAREELELCDNDRSETFFIGTKLIEKLMSGLVCISNTNANPKLVLESLLFN